MNCAEELECSFDAPAWPSTSRLSAWDYQPVIDPESELRKPGFADAHRATASSG